MTKFSVMFVLAAAFLMFAGALAEAANPKVLLKTSKGDITIELYADKAPMTVKNFLAYVDAKFYDATIFHRVVNNPPFMIQGGGYTADFKEKTSKPAIKNEAGNGLKNLRGTVAMARTMDVDSATNQFFINLVNNAFLDHKTDTAEGFGYCVFGNVTAGMDVVDAIATAPTGVAHGMRDVPRETITILSVRRL
jgi:peptidyl-prolyl cis-trans isomerase A (cyclophilin A)